MVQAGLRWTAQVGVHSALRSGALSCEWDTQANFCDVMEVAMRGGVIGHRDLRKHGLARVRNCRWGVGPGWLRHWASQIRRCFGLCGVMGLLLTGAVCMG